MFLSLAINSKLAIYIISQKFVLSKIFDVFLFSFQNVETYQIHSSAAVYSLMELFSNGFTDHYSIAS